MPANSAKTIKNPIFNDFVYSVLYNASYQEKRGLRGRLMKAAMNQSAAKYFCNYATWEEKEELLAHFGIEHFTVFVKTKNIKLKQLGTILEKYEKDGEQLALQDIVDAKIFVTGDPQFIQLFRLMAKSIHKPQYFLNLELTRAGYHINKWKRRNVNKDDMAVREALENANVLARYLLSGGVKMQYSKGMTGITDFTMQVLLYFFVYANNYLAEPRIYDYFAGYKTNREIRCALTGLTKADYLQKNLKAPKELCITTKGIINVHNFIDEVMSGTNF